LRISRTQLMAGLFIFSSAGGLLPRVIMSVDSSGSSASALDAIKQNIIFWGASAFDTFNTSIIVWGAWASACYLALSAGDRDRVRPLDIAVACGTFAIAAFPAAPFSWLALSLFSSYVYLTSPRKSPLRRSAVIFFAICIPMLWGPALLVFAAPILLKIDAFLVATVIGAEHTGNVVHFAPRSHGLRGIQIWPPCSSFHNFSHAALAWVALSQVLGRDLKIADIFWCGFVTILAASVNVARLSTIALWPEYFDTIHGPVGGQIAGTLAILLIAFVCMFGQRRELFARA
jgi:hypothetical protein